MPTTLSTGDGRTSNSRHRVISGLSALAVTTATLEPQEAMLLVFNADNLMHEHQAAGMMTWFVVEMS